VTGKAAEFSRCDAVTDKMQIRQRTTNPMNGLLARNMATGNHAHVRRAYENRSPTIASLLAHNAFARSGSIA
jgi:hypothetical protein